MLLEKKTAIVYGAAGATGFARVRACTRARENDTTSIWVAAPLRLRGPPTRKRRHVSAQS